MPSISHRASLGQGAPHRAKSGPAALPAGFTGGFFRGIVGGLVQRRDNWGEMRRIGALDDHRPRDICLAETDAHHSDIHVRDPKGMPTWPTIF